jgi:beta-glucanase (GH16 family)
VITIALNHLGMLFVTAAVLAMALPLPASSEHTPCTATKDASGVIGDCHRAAEADEPRGGFRKGMSDACGSATGKCSTRWNAAQVVDDKAAPSRGGFDPTAAGYRLVFEDRFRTFDTSIDGTHGWMTRWNYTPENSDNINRVLQMHDSYYSDASVGYNPFGIANGVLTITAAPAIISGANAAKLPYNSGTITSFSSFYIKYGYFEMRAQLPAGRGLWSAFWMVSKTRKWPPEIDCFEVLGDKPTVMYGSTHDLVDGQDVARTTSISVADTSTAFHVYGVDWQPSRLVYYFDGQPVLSYPTLADMSTPMYIIVTLAVGAKGSWPGPPSANTKFPAVMLIDYVRAYASSYSSDIGGSLARVTQDPPSTLQYRDAPPPHPQ